MPIRMVYSDIYLIFLSVFLLINLGRTQPVNLDNPTIYPVVSSPIEGGLQPWLYGSEFNLTDRGRDYFGPQ